MIDPSLLGTLGAPGPSWGGAPPGEYRPREDHRPREPVLGREPATFGRRWAAWTIDQVLLFVIALIFVMTLLAVAGVDLEAVDAGDTQAQEDAAVVYAAGSVLSFAYFWVWNAIGYTPGKQMLGLRIVDADGGAPGWGRGFARTVGAPLSMVLLALGYLWMLWDGKHQTWHDKQASTFVVRELSRRR